MFNNLEYQYTNITSATTTQVFSGRGTLHNIVVNTTAAGAIDLIDGTSGSTANIGSLASNIAQGTYRYDIGISSGLRIVTGAASNITVCWSK